MIELWEFLHCFIFQNFTQSTLINIHLDDHSDEHDDDVVFKDPLEPAVLPRRPELFFYDHPVLRRIEGMGLFYLSAIADPDVRVLDLTAADSGRV